MYKRQVLLCAVPIFVYILRNGSGNLNKLLILDNVVGVVAILSGIAGILIGVAGMRQANLDAVKEYFQQGDNSDYVKARRNISSSESSTFKDEDVAEVCNFFHMWGLLNRKRYLPMWVFEGSSGIRVVELYIKLYGAIKKRRERDNTFYAEEFEYLAYRIYGKYKKNFREKNIRLSKKDLAIFIKNASDYNRSITRKLR